MSQRPLVVFIHGTASSVSSDNWFGINRIRLLHTWGSSLPLFAYALIVSSNLVIRCSYISCATCSSGSTGRV
jgi:hypothetical protein